MNRTVFQLVSVNTRTSQTLFVQTPASPAARLKLTRLVKPLPADGRGEPAPLRDEITVGDAGREPRTLLVASTGGHLAELHRLRDRLDGLVGRPLWVTFDTEQSRSLLAGEDVVYVPLTAPRDYKNVLKNFVNAWKIMRTHRVDMVVSTGSGIALSFFPFAWAKGASCHFIETAARRRGPSLTGRLVGLLPGVRRYTQCEAWQSKRWVYKGSLFDGFTESERKETPVDRPTTVVVTLGTMKQSFEAALNPLVDILAAEPEFDVRWQVGNTPTDGLDIDGHVSVPPQRLQGWIADADLVIAHAGMGSTLDALEAGRKPLLIARSVSRGEHIDDHQVEIASELADRGLANVVEPGDLSLARLRESIGARVDRADTTEADRFELNVGPRALNAA